MSLRALMILVLVVAAGLGWRVNRAHTRTRAVARIHQAGGIILYDYQFDGTYPVKWDSSPWAPAWLREPLGDEYFQEVTYISFSRFERLQELADSDLAVIEGLDRLLLLDLADAAEVTDAGLAHLAGLRRLERLSLMSVPRVTDAGLAHLAGLRRLEHLSLCGLPRVTDAGLAHLAGLTAVRKLALMLEGITDAGLAHLSHLTGLGELDLVGCTRLSGAGLAHLEDLTNLRTLRLIAVGGAVGEKSLANDDLAHLASLINLQELDLSSNFEISDAGMRHLRGLHQLRKLKLEMTQVSDRAIDELQAAIPGLVVSRP